MDSEVLARKCLLCSSFGPCLINLFGVEGRSLHIADILNKHFWFEIKEQDNSGSLSICQDCWDNTSRFHEFYCRIERICGEESLLRENTEVYIKEEINDSERNELYTETIWMAEPSSLSVKSEVHSLSFSANEEERTDNVARPGEASAETPAEAKEIQSNSQPPAKNSDRILSKQKKATQLQRIKEFYNMKCALCTQTFENCLQIRSHYRDKHNQQGYLICCGKKIEAHVCWLLEHINFHTNPMDFVCKICRKQFGRMQGLQNHIRLHEPDVKSSFICDMCGKGFAIKAHLKPHFRTHSKDKEYVSCHICEQRFSSKPSLTNHIHYIHQNTETYVCEICAKTFRTKALLKLHSDTHNNDRIRCNVCNLSLKNQKTLRSHMMTHTAPTNEQCPVCGKIMPNARSLRSHLQVHRDPIHECNICKKSFNNLGYFEQHMASHTGEFMFPCPYCPQAFAFKANLNMHKKRKHQTEWLRDKQKRVREKYQGFD